MIMLSTLPARFFGDQFPSFEPGFLHEPSFLFGPIEKEQVSSNSGSDASNPVHVEPPFLFDPIEKEQFSPNSGSDTSNPVHAGLDCKEPDPKKSGSIVDERKKRRMVSNRESARRSRMRKQKHLENLRNNFTRLKVANRELKNRVQLAAHQNQFICRENECLKSEAVMLRKTLWDMRQVLLVRQLQNQQRFNTTAWPCNNVTSLITQL